MKRKSSRGWGLLNGVWILLIVLVALNRESTAPLQEIGDRLSRTIKGVDLGTVTQPPGETSYQSTRHMWRAKGLAPYRLTFDHGHQAMISLYSKHARLGEVLGWPRTLPQSTRCRYRPWACVYTEVSKLNAADLSLLLDRMQLAIASSEWNTRQTATWLLAFVQDIPYRVPEALAFQVLPPALVVSENWGDCDSKSLLLLHLLQRAGIDARIFVSRAHEHAMVGIFVPTSGKTIRHEGRSYAWAETTGKAPLGWIDPQMLRPNDWYGVEVRVAGL